MAARRQKKVRVVVGKDVLRRDSSEVKIKDLFQAVVKNDLQQVKFLIDRGTHVDLVGPCKDTPLTHAARSSQAGTVQLLLDHGADVNHMNADKNTPLSIAAAWGRTEIVQLLIDRGADLNTTNMDLRTPIMLASLGADLHVQVLSLLIKAGASLDYQDKDGNTAFMMAFVSGGNCMRKVELLLDAGADTSLENKKGKTALTLYLNPSAYNGSRMREVIDLIVSKTTYFGRDYHLLILHNHPIVNKCLVNRKVLPSVEYVTIRDLPYRKSFLGGQGLTPLTCALSANNNDLANFFVANWFLHDQDLALGCSNLYECLRLGENSCEFLKNMFRQPWTLKSLSFIKVSTCLGFGRSREERVRNSSLPPMMQRWLRFETPDWNIPPTSWSELTFQSVHMNRTDRRHEE